MNRLPQGILDSCWDQFKQVSHESDGTEMSYIDINNLFNLNSVLEETVGRKLLGPAQLAALAKVIEEAEAENSVMMQKDDLEAFYQIITDQSLKSLLSSRSKINQDKNTKQVYSDNEYETYENLGDIDGIRNKNDGNVDNDVDMDENKGGIDNKNDNNSKSDTNSSKDDINSNKNDISSSKNDIYGNKNDNLDTDENEEEQEDNDDILNSPLAGRESRRKTFNLATSTPLFSSRIRELSEDTKGSSSSKGSKESFAKDVSKYQAIIDSKEEDIVFRDQLIVDLEKQIKDFKESIKMKEKQVEELQHDKEVLQNSLAALELRTANVDVLKKSLDEQEVENNRLVNVNKKLNKEVDELYNKLVNIETLQEKLRSGKETNETYVENKLLKEQVYKLQQQLVNVNNEHSLEISSLKLKNVTIKEELAKVQDQLTDYVKKYSGKVVVSASQLKELKESRLKQFKYMQKIQQRQERLAKNANIVSLLTSSNDLFTMVYEELSRLLQNTLYKSFFILIILLIFFSFIRLNPPRNDSINMPSNHPSNPSTLALWNLKLQTLLQPHYIVPRHRFNVDEMVQRNAFDESFRNFLQS